LNLKKIGLKHRSRFKAIFLRTAGWKRIATQSYFIILIAAQQSIS